MWRAFRSERLEFARGREPFADFVDDTVCKFTAEHSVYLDTGQAFHLPIDPPDPKTLDNFFKTTATVFAPRAIPETNRRSIKTSIEALRYIHVFLWARQRERVLGWRNHETKTRDDLVISGVDDSFEIQLPAQLIPVPVLLSKTVPEKGARNMAKHQKYVEKGRKENLESFDGWEEIGVLALDTSSEDITALCVYLTYEQWVLLQIDFSKADITADFNPDSASAKEKFDDRMQILTGVCSAIRTKDIVLTLKKRPRIESDQGVIALEMKKYGDENPQYGWLTYYHNQDEPALVPSNILDGLLSMHACQFGLGDDQVSVTPTLVSESEQELIGQICAMITK